MQTHTQAYIQCLKTHTLIDTHYCTVAHSSSYFNTNTHVETDQQTFYGKGCDTHKMITIVEVFKTKIMTLIHEPVLFLLLMKVCILLFYKSPMKDKRNDWRVSKCNEMRERMKGRKSPTGVRACLHVNVWVLLARECHAPGMLCKAEVPIFRRGKRVEIEKEQHVRRDFLFLYLCFLHSKTVLQSQSYTAR